MDIENLNPIFNALVKLGQERKNIRITFFTRYINKIYFAAQEYGVENQVFHNERIPYRESLRVQRNADILLFLIPHQFGNLTTKIFEYIAALRPVLAIGDIKSTAGRFIEEIGIGLVSDDPGKISSQLHHWLEMKKNIREIPDNPLSIRAGFSREGQFEKIENFIIPLIAQGEK
ncbi:MAG: glycosyltransferase family 4 protein [Chloroflexi bacterium]|nr:glycosyltransferase family 4 protein [Chloroflexota bacterium]